MRKFTSFMLVAFVMLASALAVIAQTPTGIINGTVADPNGAALSGATVKGVRRA